jgi:hypothetical protein
MADLSVLRAQEYSTNLELLSQQMTPKLAPYATVQSGVGSKALRMVSQVAETDGIAYTTRATPAMNLDVGLDGRWVYPQFFAWGTVVDDAEALQTNIAPQGAYVRTAVAYMNRKKDDLFINAFFGTSQTGETGGTAVTFPAAQQVAVTVGTGAATGLNVEKLRAGKRLLLEADVDLDMEQIYCAVSPLQHDNLLALTQVVSTDFNDRPVLVDGMVRQFLGINFVISNRLPTDSNSYRRNPMWVPSGMGCGEWQAIQGTIRTRPDLQFDPDYVEAKMGAGFTRLEEAKCVELKSSEA